MEAMENSGIIPEKVTIKHNAKLFLLYDIFEKLNIEVEVVDFLEVIPQIKREMFNILLY